MPSQEDEIILRLLRKIGKALSEKHPNKGKQNYKDAHVKLWQRYGLNNKDMPGYKKIPPEKFDDAVEFLEKWHDRLIKS